MTAKEKAIRALQSQKEKIRDYSVFNNVAWGLETLELVKKYFGETSGYFTEAKSLKFYLDNYRDSSTDKRKATEFIDGCIRHIKEHGTFQEKKDPFLLRIKAGWLVAFVFILLPSIFRWGMHYQSQKEKENATINMMQKTIDILSDSIRTLRIQPTDSVPNEQAQPPSNQRNK